MKKHYKKKHYFVVVSGPTPVEKRICENYADARELLIVFADSTLETFDSLLEAEMFSLYGCTTQEELLDVAWNELPINSSLWRELFLDSKRK